MALVALFITALAYGGAGYLWWRQRTPVYVLALAAGQLSTLALPLWRLLYTLREIPSLGALLSGVGQPVAPATFFAAAWPEPLPALVVFGLYLTRWWFPGALSGGFTFLIFVSFHLLTGLLGLREELPIAALGQLPLGLSGELLAALMAATVSYGLLYCLLAVYRYAWLSMALALLPAPLLLGLAIYGLLGAPIWVGRLVGDSAWAASLGTALTLLLLGWAVLIISSGLRRTAG